MKVIVCDFSQSCAKVTIHVWTGKERDKSARMVSILTYSDRIVSIRTKWLAKPGVHLMALRLYRMKVLYC